MFLFKKAYLGIWLAQLVEHGTLFLKYGMNLHVILV